MSSCLTDTTGLTLHDLTARVDSEAATLSMTRQSNRKSGIPLTNFTGGITDLPKRKSQEYPALILVWMVILGMGSRYLSQPETRMVQHALAALYLTWYVLKRTWYDREEVKSLPDLIARCVATYMLLHIYFMSSTVYMGGCYIPPSCCYRKAY